MKALITICAMFVAQSAFAGIVVPSGTYTGSGTWTKYDASGNAVATGPASSTWIQQNTGTTYIGNDDTTLYSVDASGNQTAFFQNQNQYQFDFSDPSDANAYRVLWQQSGQSIDIGPGETQGNGYSETLNQQGLVNVEQGNYDASTQILTRSSMATLPDGTKLGMALTLLKQ